MKWYQHIFGDVDSRAKYKEAKRVDELKKLASDIESNPSLNARNAKNNDEIRVKKGEYAYRVTNEKNETNSGSTYMATVDRDVLGYIGWAVGEDPTKLNKNYQVKLKVTNDIIAPSLDKAEEIVFNKLKDKKVTEIVDDIYLNNVRKTNPLLGEKLVKLWSNLDVKECRDLAYMHYFMSVVEGKNEDKKREFFQAVKDAGYNAILDQNDAGKIGIKPGWAKQPLIVFERENNLKQVKALELNKSIGAYAKKKAYEMYVNK